MKSLNINQTKEMLQHVAYAVINSKELLTEIDSKIGDGDHGIGMELGMKKALEALDNIAAPESVNELYKNMGRAMMMSMGGASGVIFGTLFQSGAKIPSCTALDANSMKCIFRTALDAIKKRGGAQLGDKTMIDALEPAVLAIEESSSEELEELLQEAVVAAAQGVENTKNYAAKFGRAKSLMERSIGYQDAGATSVWIIINAMLDYVKNI